MKKGILFVVLIAFVFIKSNAQNPTIQASAVNISYKTTTGATINWTGGNGSNCMVVIHPSGNSNVAPPSSTTTNYVANATYGNGSNLGSNNYVVYKGNSTSVFVSGLSPNTAYYAYVYEYNTVTIFSTTYYFNTSTSGNGLFFATYDSSPTGSYVTSVTPSYTSATVFLAAGNGDGRLCVASLQSAGTAYPSDGYDYSANVNYGSGALISPGYVVYKGSGTSFTLNNLQPATNYYVNSNEYNNGTYPTSSWGSNTRNYYLYGSYAFSTLNNPPTLNTITNLSICQDASLQTVNLSGIGDGSTQENQSLSVTASSSNTSIIPNPTVTYTSPNTTGSISFTPIAGASGTVTLTVTVNDGWTSNNTIARTFTVTVNPKPFAPGSVTANNVVCGGSSMSFSVSPITNATGYNWVVPSGFSITSGSNTNSITVSTPTVSSVATRTITVNGTNSCGSGTSSSKVVQLDPEPTSSNAGIDQTLICTNTAFLSGNTVNSPNVGTWQWLSGTPTPSIGSVNSASTSLTGLTSPQTYQYIWVITNTTSVCPSKKDTVSLTTNWANPACQPTANFSFGPTSDVSSTSVCVGTNVNFTDLSISANQWEWDFTYNGSSPNVTSTAQNPSHSYGAVGTYTVYLRIFSNLTSQYYTTTKTINVIGAPAQPGTIFGTNSGICAGDPNQFVYSIATVTNATNYNWNVPTGANIVANPSSTSIAVMYSNNAIAGNITVSASNSCGTSTLATQAIAVNPLPDLPGTISGPSTVCQGEPLAVYSIAPVNNASGYQWTFINGQQNNTVLPTKSYSFGVNAQSGRIYVKGINSCGHGDSVAINVTVDPLPAAIGQLSGANFLSICPAQTAVGYSISPVQYATSYNWYVIGGGTIINGTSTDSITVDFTGQTNNVLISVSPVNSCGSRDTSSIITVSFDAVPAVNICLVTVDTLSQHNEIYWEHPATSGIDSFRIYRRKTLFLDTLVATVAYSDTGSVVDMLTDYNPNVSAEEYAIAAVDSCGNEGAKSAYHKTMLLTTGFGPGVINLNWNHYLGQSANFYMVYRDTTGLGGANWELLDPSVIPTINAWVDLAPPTTVSNVRYKIETDWFTTCDPARGAINTSRSNIKTNSITGLHDINLNESDITMFPNPAQDLLNITLNRKLTDAKVIVFDALGRVVISGSLNNQDNTITLSLSSIESGIYVLSVISKEGSIKKRFLKEN